MRFAIYDTSGRIWQICTAPGIEDMVSLTGPDRFALEVEDSVSDATHYVRITQGSSGQPNPTAICLPPRPTAQHVWDWLEKQWADPRTLNDIKLAKWAIIKQARSSAEFGGFTWDGSPFDSDAISQSRIQGAVQLAAMAPGFTIDWTLANNSVRNLSAADLANVGAALGMHVAAQHAKARLLRSQIEVATTVAEVDAVTW